MSWQATAWMDSLPYDIAKPLASRVLLKLANVAAADGNRAWRNVWEMADELGADRRSVQRALRELQALDLILIGDQQSVAHLNPNRRPTVYNLNFGWHRMYSQPEIHLPDELDEPEEIAPDLGAAQLSTGDLGATLGATSEVPLGTNRTTYLTLKEETYVPERALAHENEDAFGGSLRPAAASTEACPTRRAGHVYARHTDTTCASCGMHRDQSYDPISGDIHWKETASA